MLKMRRFLFGIIILGVLQFIQCDIIAQSESVDPDSVLEIQSTYFDTTVSTSYLPHIEPLRMIPSVDEKNIGLANKKLRCLDPSKYSKEKNKVTFDTIFSKLDWQHDTALQQVLGFPVPTVAEIPRFKDVAIADIKYLDVDQGLSSSYIFTSIIDSRGFLWLGTFNGGLVRYNGNSFITYTIDNGLPDNSVRSLLEDSKGRIWIGTAGSGICIYDGHTLVSFPDTLILNQLYPYEMKQDADGAVWIATMQNGVFKITDDAILQMRTDLEFMENRIFTVLPFKTGATWLSSDSSIYRLNKDTLEKFVFDEDSVGVGVKAMLERSDGEFFFGGRYKFLYYKDSEFFEMMISDSLSIIGTKSIAQADANSIWIGTQGEGVYKMNFDGSYSERGTLRNYNIRHGLSQNYVSSLSLAGDILWISTYGGGVNRLTTSLFEHVTRQQGIGSDLVWAFAEDDQQRLWMGTEKAGICKFDNETFKHYEKHSGMVSHIVLSGMADLDTVLWFGTYKGGLYKIEDTTLYRIELIPDNKSLSVISMLQTRSGDYWFGTWSHGLFKYDGEHVVRYFNETGIGKDAIFDIMEDCSGDLWLATEGSGVYRISDDRLINYSTENILPSNDCYSVVQLKDKTIWVGTSGAGVFILNGDKHIRLTQGNGLSSNIVSSIIQDKDGRVWVGTEYGLNLIQYKSNENSPAMSADDFSITVFDRTDGLKGLDFYNNSVYIDVNNRIWWGTGKALTSLDLNEFKHSSANGKVHIEAIQVNQQWVDFHDFELEKKRLKQTAQVWNYTSATASKPFLNAPEDIILPYDLRHVTFRYSSSGWSNPQKVKYYTRLSPLETKWSIGTNESKAEYRNIPPGSYVFEVYAVGKMGDKSHVAMQHIEVSPPWWMTVWAYLVYALLALVGFLVAHRLRTRVLKQRQKELEHIVQERTLEIQEKNEELRTLIAQISDQRNELEIQRNTVVKQRDQLKQYNTSISQSIDYAQRIQSSLLSDYKSFNDVFPSSFLLFKPRDIVSGDFYWWVRIDNQFFVVVADCTGHGVPGAFMSMLGISFLREIVLKGKTIQPDEILNKLRDEIIHILKQQQTLGEQRDGMDMSLIRYDLDTKELLFSGAHHALLLNDGREVHEIKGDRLPIAIYPKMKPFTTKRIDFKPGDRIYMFTDGFQDQFGGDKGSKIKKSGFVSLIEQYTQSPMKEQKELLESFLDQWQGDSERLDDVLILGFEMPD